jgi:hypothetical protein
MPLVVIAMSFMGWTVAKISDDPTTVNYNKTEGSHDVAAVPAEAMA